MIGRSQSPRGLKRRSTVGWVSVVSDVFCQVELSATHLQRVQRSPTDCDASLCVIKYPREWEGHVPRWTAAPQKKEIPVIALAVVMAVTFRGWCLKFWHPIVLKMVTSFRCHLSPPLSSAVCLCATLLPNHVRSNPTHLRCPHSPINYSNPENGCNMFVRNIGIPVLEYATSRHTNPWAETLL